MNVILCADCGKVMSRYTLQCVKCHRDNLESFKDANSDQFRTRLKQVERYRERPSATKSAFVVMLVAVTISAITMGWERINPMHFLKANKIASRGARHTTARQTAATDSAITH